MAEELGTSKNQIFRYIRLTNLILDDLYNGKIYPFEQIVSTDKNYRPINTKVGEMRDYFMEKLPPDDREKFSQWNRFIHEIDYMDSYANFVYGFRLERSHKISTIASTGEPVFTIRRGNKGKHIL